MSRNRMGGAAIKVGFDPIVTTEPAPELATLATSDKLFAAIFRWVCTGQTFSKIGEEANCLMGRRLSFGEVRGVESVRGLRVGSFFDLGQGCCCCYYCCGHGENRRCPLSFMDKQQWVRRLGQTANKEGRRAIKCTNALLGRRWMERKQCLVAKRRLLSLWVVVVVFCRSSK